MNQSPQFINGSESGALTMEQIKMLARDLTNASKVKKSEGNKTVEKITKKS